MLSTTPYKYMEVKTAKNTLYIKSGYFSAEQILFSGQVFRFRPYKNGYTLNTGSEFAYIETCGEETHITCTDEKYFYNYFDLETDYEQIACKLRQNPLTEKAVNFGKGVRILKQQKIETIINFIISANNNIKRISGIIENICNNLGEKRSFNGLQYYTFPSLCKLAAAGEDFYRTAGAGYRAGYIANTADRLLNNFDIDSLNSLNTIYAEKALMGLKGIGKKVADCILLFAFNRTDIFPTDTWIEKAYCSNFEGKELCREDISRYFADMFKDLAGYAQQYLFYYMRNNNSKK